MLFMLDSLQASLHSEKERADDSERKIAEAQTTVEERQKMLEEAEGKVRNLQDSLSRLMLNLFLTFGLLTLLPCLSLGTTTFGEWT